MKRTVNVKPTLCYSTLYKTRSEIRLKCLTARRSKLQKYLQNVLAYGGRLTEVQARHHEEP
jgi:hypothetical protein